VSSDLLKAFQVLTDLAVEYVGQRLRVLAVLDVLLPVEEPVWNLVLARVRHHGNHLLHLVQDTQMKLKPLSWSTMHSITWHHCICQMIPARYFQAPSASIISISRSLLLILVFVLEIEPSLLTYHAFGIFFPHVLPIDLSLFTGN